MQPNRPPTARSKHRRALVIAAAIVLVITAVVVRLATLTPADAIARPAFPTTVRLAGAAPRPAWPASGQAALAVPGLGSLGSFGGDTPRPIASLAKIMTAYLTLERYPLSRGSAGFTLTVTPAEASAEQADSREGQSVVAVRAGEQLDERQLLEGLLIASGDNLARMLAVHEAGSVSRFVAEMNSTARALGMNATTYAGPSGYAPATVSDADDQLRIFERAIGFAVFRQIVSMPTATLPVAGTVSNYDPLIGEGYYGKTGSDSAAEGCLAFFKRLTVDGRRLTVVGVVLDQGYGAETSLILGQAGIAAQRLFGSVAPAIAARNVVPRHARVVIAAGADGQRIDGVAARPLQVIGWGGLRERVTIRTHALRASVNAGATLGQVLLSGRLPIPAGGPRRSAVRASKPLGAPGIGWRLGHLF